MQPAFAPLVPSRAGEPGFVRDDCGRRGRRGRRALDLLGAGRGRAGRGSAGPAPPTPRSSRRRRSRATSPASTPDHGVPYGSAAILLRSTGASTPISTPCAAPASRSWSAATRSTTAGARSSRPRPWCAPCSTRATTSRSSTVLRSPLVGVPDAALVPLWRRGFPRLVTDLAAPRPRAASSASARRSTRPRPRSSAARPSPGSSACAAGRGACSPRSSTWRLLRASFESEPAGGFLERLRAALAASRPSRPPATSARYRLANLERFFRQLGAALEEGEGRQRRAAPAAGERRRGARGRGGTAARGARRTPSRCSPSTAPRGSSSTTSTWRSSTPARGRSSGRRSRPGASQAGDIRSGTTSRCGCSARRASASTCSRPSAPRSRRPSGCGRSTSP